MKNKFWFRKRRGLFSRDLGWGWVPISWQGNVTILLFILANIVVNIYSGFPYAGNSVAIFLTMLGLSIILFAIIANSKTKKERKK